MTFGDSAARLNRLAARALGWRPQEFWTATPAELAAILIDPETPAPLGRRDLTRMMEQER